MVDRSAFDDPPQDARRVPSRNLTTSLHVYHSGEVLGRRYRIEELLGRGGMGEVWRAFDLKLRVEVALKFLHPNIGADPGRIDLVRREVRAARNVTSPNVCRVFDLVEIDGQELVSMEYVDGSSLEALLEERGPLDITEAREIASQMLAGLQAIHDAGLMHRDLKPANVMRTRAGRVVVMDFGLAKGFSETQSLGIAGTPAYMAPEQASGGPLDARTDVFAAGVILAEMVGSHGPGDSRRRRALRDGLRAHPPQVPPGPWHGPIQTAVAEDPHQRFVSASALARALEEGTQRLACIEDVTPYPGLSSFAENDARFFFGRERDVESTWNKLRRLPMLAVIGPSGVGKSSFLRAGLIPAAPPGWQCAICTPGRAPFASLAQSLVVEFAGETEVMRHLVGLDDVDRAIPILHTWRERHEAVLLIVDQFEELFTINPPEVQARFAELLGRLTVEADIHLLVSMRDDFFFLCHELRPLSPLFTASAPLGPLAGEDLERALVHPAQLCGYRFDDATLVKDMLAEVAGERGALPLLAFAAARLWERRDRSRGMITRQAFEEIGGVAGALAQHAETTLDGIGEERRGIVRDFFRSLVTAHGTRLVRDREELLSVARDRAAAEQVLQALIEARLLTSFEVTGGEEEADKHQCVEIIHESLLTAWPRLVRWQAQDAEGTLLRDQLRQAAQLWEERSRSEDLLWTGTAYREFELWRERYPGELTATEKAFSRAMITRARRRRRRRRLAVGASFLFLIAVLVTVEASRQRVVLEARRGEARRLAALGGLELDAYPTASLAYARASLELLDSPEARRLVGEALWRGGVEWLLDTEGSGHLQQPEFSPDGQWLAVPDRAGQILVYDQAGGSPVVIETSPGESPYAIFDSSGSILAVRSGDNTSLRVVSTQNWETVRTFEMEAFGRMTVCRDEVLTTRADPGDPTRWTITAWPLKGGEPRLLDTITVPRGQGFRIDPVRRRIASGQGEDLVIQPLDPGIERDRLVGRHQDEVDRILWARERSDRIVAHDRSDHFRVWSLERGLQRALEVPVDARAMIGASLDGSGRWLAVCTPYGPVYLWDLDGLAVALPRRIATRSQGSVARSVVIDPRGRWLVVPRKSVLSFCPLEQPRVHVIPFHEGHVWAMLFTPKTDGLLVRTTRRLALLPLTTESGERAILDCGSGYQVGVSPDGSQVATTVYQSGICSVLVVPIHGTSFGEPVALLSRAGVSRWPAVFDPTGRYLATATFSADTPGKQLLEIVDLQTQQVRAYALVDPERSEPFDPTDGGVTTLSFAPDGSLLSCGEGGIRRWNILTGVSEIVSSASNLCTLVSSNGRLIGVATYDWREWSIEDGGVLSLETGAMEPIDELGSGEFALDPTLTVAVAGDSDGIVKVGRVGGGEPHLLFGHEGMVMRCVVSPDGRWIASATDAEIRLWPMPNMSEPPLHTLPYDELMDKLETFTNLRAVRDGEAANGWRLAIGPFPGWETAPQW